MTTPHPLHPWVAQRRGQVNFATQLIASYDDPQGPAIVQAAKLVDDLGVDAIFLSDHPTWAPEPYVHLAAMAMVTKRVGLGPMVAASPYRNPVHYARLVSDIDHLSNGRAINGLGIGWNAAEWDMGNNEFERMGIPYPPTPDRQAALEEAIAIMRGAWSGEPFTLLGDYFQVEQARVPPTSQQPEPPLVIAGAGKKTLNQVARLADMSNFGSGPSGQVDGPAEAAQRLAVLRAQCELVERTFEDIIRSHFIHWLMLAKDYTALDAKVKHYFPDGVSGFWGNGLIALTVAEAAPYFQRYVDIGMNYFVIQSLDVHDEETLTLLLQEVKPMLKAEG